MKTFIDSIIHTRKIASTIFENALNNLAGLSEFDIAEKVKEEAKNYDDIYPEGWYSPPPAGVAILISKPPYERLQYESLRKEEYWPKKDLILEPETVAMFYCSPVNKSGAIGDIGFTFYNGANEKIKQHLKNCYTTTLAIAKEAKVGMKFSELSEFGLKLIDGKYKLTKWVTTNSVADYKINLGHTVPGSFEENFSFGSTFEEIKETIKSKRLHVKDTENFEIPNTCAFTIELRLEDINDPNMPSGYYHFIVCFSEGEKTILENYSQIFKNLGMDYMN